MDLIDTLRVLRRHWIVTTLLLLVTLGAVGGVLFVLPWTYSAQSTVVLLPSRDASKLTGGNPYLSFDSSVTNTAYVVSVAVMSPSEQQALVAAGHTGTYTIAPSAVTTGPVLVTQVTAPSKSQAEGTLMAVTAAIGARLRAMQGSQKIGPNNQITVRVESVTPEATRLISKKAKTLVLALAVGLFLTICVPLLIDASARENERDGQPPGQPPGKRLYVPGRAAPSPASQRRNPAPTGTSRSRNGNDRQTVGIDRATPSGKEAQLRDRLGDRH
jgi:hypothetical protein